jgi:hypothetical protein
VSDERKQKGARSNDEDPVRLAVDRYVPGRGISEDQWARLAPAVRAAVLRLAPSSPVTARRDPWYLARFLAWAEDSGLPTDVETVLAPDHVNRYCGSKKQGGERSSTRSHLARIGSVIVPQRWPAPETGTRGKSLPPYTREDQALLLEYSYDLTPSSLREFAIALVAVGLGCGPSAKELPNIRADEVRRQNGAVTVQIADRAVPCRAAYEDLVWERALSCRGDLLLAPRVDSQIARVHDQWEGIPLRLQVARLRLTWLVEVLTTGVPLPAVIRAAGLRSLHSLDIALRHLPMPGESETAILRGSPTK